METVVTMNQPSRSYPPYRWYNFILNIVSIVLYVFDVGSDISLCVRYWNQSETTYAALTLLFIAAPWLVLAVTMVFSRKMREATCYKRIVMILLATTPIGPMM